MRYARRDPAYRGAFFTGSTVGLADDAELSPVSDVDVLVVTAGEDRTPKPGKFRHSGALLEVGRVPWHEVASAEAVLSAYYLAGSFRTDTVIDDPTGHLRTLRAPVSAEFARADWVRRRCADVRWRVAQRLGGIDPAAPIHQQVMGWLFGTGATALLPLVAALRNPTVRLRYPAARAALAEHGRADDYPGLLRLLGSADLPVARVRHHLRALGRTFDAAAQAARTPFDFSGDITADARPVALDGSRQLIERGDHREAVFWIVATFTRCHAILAADAPDAHRTLSPAFQAAVADLGIAGPDDIRRRAADTLDRLPALWATAEHIIATRPDLAH
jgi:hypothetical protein